MALFFDECDSFDFGTKTDVQKGLLLPAVQAFTQEEAEVQQGLLLPAVQAFMDEGKDATSDVWDIKDHSGGPIYHDGEVLHGSREPIDSFAEIL